MVVTISRDWSRFVTVLAGSTLLEDIVGRFTLHLSSISILFGYSYLNLKSIENIVHYQKSIAHYFIIFIFIFYCLRNNTNTGVRIVVSAAAQSKRTVIFVTKTNRPGQLLSVINTQFYVFQYIANPHLISDLHNTPPAITSRTAQPYARCLLLIYNKQITTLKIKN